MGLPDALGGKSTRIISTIKWNALMALGQGILDRFG
jgi:hypothetical protein